MSQTSLFVKMVANPGKRDEVLAALDEMLPQVQREDGTLVYSFHLDAGDENAIWVFELYRDGDALAAHAGSDAMAELMGSFGDILAEPPLMVMATPTAGAKGLPS